MRQFASIRSIALLALSVGLSSTVHAQAPAEPPTDPAAAAARQIVLGEQWFRSACLSCHAARGLDNADFRLKWNGKSAFDLFERIRSTMPETNPGSLTQGTYAAIVSYLMKLNGMTPENRVPSDSARLAAIRLSFPATQEPTRR
jgi:S-disulfanyl-L-cysteine oxidoreductase SoxD